MTVNRTGRGDDLTINILPAPFKGGEVTVSRTGRGDDLTINIPPAPFKGGDGMVSRMGKMRRLAYTKNFGERLEQILTFNKLANLPSIRYR